MQSTELSAIVIPSSWATNVFDFHPPTIQGFGGLLDHSECPEPLDKMEPVGLLCYVEVI